MKPIGVFRGKGTLSTWLVRMVPDEALARAAVLLNPFPVETSFLQE